MVPELFTAGKVGVLKRLVITTSSRSQVAGCLVQSCDKLAMDDIGFYDVAAHFFHECLISLSSVMVPTGHI